VAARAVPAPLALIPNALTIARLVLIPVFVVLLLSAEGGHSWPAAIVFGVAGVTDQIDGWLARRWRVESSFGKIADPLADRLMIDAAVILLWTPTGFPGWRWLSPHVISRSWPGTSSSWVAATTSRSTSPARRRRGCCTPRSPS
jgi:CDP-diacylglycerol--glycerol-3-phosphate 3-phosphatidyltransferase